MKAPATANPLGVRLPPKVREQVELTANIERRSLNSQITVLIERGLRTLETKAATEAGTPIAVD